MNAGKDKQKAIRQAQANAKSSGNPWIIFFSSHLNVYWVENATTYYSAESFEEVAMPDGAVISGNEYRNLKIIYAQSSEPVQFRFGLAKTPSPEMAYLLEQSIREISEILEPGLIHVVVKHRERRIEITTHCPPNDRERRSKVFQRLITEKIENEKTLLT